MDRLSLKADERLILGKKVKRLRKDGFLPGHVFGKDVDGENVMIDNKNFLHIFHLAGETGLIDLQIGGEKIRPVLIRGVQYDPITDSPLNVDFYQVNLKEKVKVPVPLILIGEEPEAVHLGEAIVLQTLNEVEVEALPADLVEKIEVDIAHLKNINDAVTVAGLNYDKEKLTVLAGEEEIVVKLAPAVTAEMEQLLEEEAAEVAEAAAEAPKEEGAEAPVEGEPSAAGAVEGKEAVPSEGEAATGSEENKQVEEKAKE